MEIDAQLFNYLQSLNSFDYSDLSNPPYVIHEVDMQGFESGVKLIPLINQLAMKRTSHEKFALPDVSELQESNTTNSRLYN